MENKEGKQRKVIVFETQYSQINAMYNERLNHFSLTSTKDNSNMVTNKLL